MIDRLIRSNANAPRAVRRRGGGAGRCFVQGLHRCAGALATITDSGVVYAINGAPAGCPDRAALLQRNAARGRRQFHLRHRLRHRRDRGTPCSCRCASCRADWRPPTRWGCRRSARRSMLIGSAPKSGYRADTAMVVRPGQAVDRAEPGPARLRRVDHWDDDSRQARRDGDRPGRLASSSIRYTVDPNCGFRSFATGIPKD